MDQELKKKWVTALRSGEYRQGTSALKQRFGDGPAEFCCIGVLAEVADLGLVHSSSTTTFQGEPCRRWAVDGDEGQLTDTALAQVGLDDREQSELITMNDVRGASFADIADYIETNL